MPNISPTFWGPSLWAVIHIIPFGYEPNEDNKKNYKLFFQYLSNVIPCSKCKEHHKKLMKNEFALTDDILSSQDKFIKWTYDYHKYVNENKMVINEYLRTKTISYDKFLNIYTNVGPELWGPPFWFFFHTVAFGFTDGVSKPSDYHNFYTQLAYVIPCPICRKEYFKMVTGKMSVKKITTRDGFIKWTYKIHDFVNKYKKVSDENKRTISPNFAEYYYTYNQKVI